MCDNLTMHLFWNLNNFYIAYNNSPLGNQKSSSGTHHNNWNGMAYWRFMSPGILKLFHLSRQEQKNVKNKIKTVIYNLLYSISWFFLACGELSRTTHECFYLIPQSFTKNIDEKLRSTIFSFYINGPYNLQNGPYFNRKLHKWSLSRKQITKWSLLKISLNFVSVFI